MNGLTSNASNFLSRMAARPTRQWAVGATFAALLVFLTDVFTLPGYPLSGPYILVIFAVGFTGKPRLIIGITALCLGLASVASLFDTSQWPGHLVLANRTATLLMIVVSGTVVRLASHQYQTLYRRERQLERVTNDLEEAQQLLKISGKIANFGGWRIDPVTSELKLTDELATMLQLAQDKPLNIDQVLAQFSPEHAETLRDLIQRALKTGESFDTELKIVTSTGAHRWGQAIGERAIDSRTGDVVVQGVFQDITARKRAQVEAEGQQQQLNLLQTAINRVDDLVLITEADLAAPGPTLVYVNDAFERLTGYSRDEVIGKSPRILQGPKTQRMALDSIRSALAAHKPVRSELINYTKDGREYWIESEMMPIVAETGEVTHLVAIERDVTARKKQEDADRQQAQLTALSERLGEIGGWIADPNANRIMWSQGAANLLNSGAPLTSELDRAFDFCAPSCRKTVFAALEACIAQGKAFSFDVEGLNGHGQPIWAHLAGTPEFDDHGGVGRVVGVVQDITRRMEMELARDAQEQMIAERTAQLEQAQRIGKIGSWRYDYDLDEFKWSAQAYVIFGVDPETFSLNVQNLLAMVHADDLPWMRERFDTSRERTETSLITYRIVRPNGEIRYVQQISEAMAENDRAIKTGTMQDVTRQVAGEIALRETEERFRYVTEVSADIIWDWDCVTGALWFSDRQPSRFGYDFKPGDAKIGNWFNVIHPEDMPMVEQAIQAATRNNAAEMSGQYRLIKADGSTATVSVLAKLIRGHDGQVVRMVGSIKDVSERVSLEAMLLSSQKLEAVGQLTGGIAHDFNNLLTVILGNAELLEDALESQPHLLKLASLSRSAAERGGQLTSRLLSFARRQPLDPRPTDIALLMTDMKPLFERTIGAEIAFSMHFGPSLFSAKVDASQLENALLNLCINARDAMPQGGSITIEARNIAFEDADIGKYVDLLPGDYVLISVTDTGCGMDAETLSKALEPFFTTKPTGKGSGLGLSMAYGFAKQSRGDMRIYSDPGHGTSVHFYLPRATTPAPAAMPRPNKASVGGHEHILLVEDDDAVRQHAFGLLSQLGYQITSAASGPEAMAELHKGHRFDLLFTDIKMPGGMNGRQLAEAARQLVPTLPVLYTSGYAEIAIVRDGQLEAGVHFLQKPYPRGALAQKIRQALDAR